MTQPRWLLVVLAVLALIVAPAQASDLEDPGDFAQIFRIGGAERIDGTGYVLAEGSLLPVLPPHDVPSNTLAQNSYIWGLEWYHDPNLVDPSLYAGTNRNLNCLLNGGFGGGEECPAPPEGALLPIPRYPDDAAQIWRYDPSAPGDQGGINGTWTQVWESPQVDNFTGCILETDTAAFDVLTFLGCLFGGPDNPAPTTVGIRNLEQCPAGGANHLYAAGLGLFGKIFVMNDAGTDFTEASSAGATFTELLQPLIDIFLGGGAIEDASALFAEIDLGYRSLTCWDPPGAAPPVLCTAPSGSVVDPDGTAHPWVLCNEDPSDTNSPWEPYSLLGFGNVNDIGVFDMTTVTVQEPSAPLPSSPAPGAPGPTPYAGEVKEYLCASSINRVDGASLYCTEGTGCDDLTPDPGGDDFSYHGCVWQEVIANGAWRPALFFGDQIGSGNGREENASFFGLGPYDDTGNGVHDYLYAGAADAAGGPTADNENAELVRVDLRGIIDDSEIVAPQGIGPAAPIDNANFLGWQLMAGVPRVTFTDDVETTVTTLETLEADGMICTEEDLFLAAGDIGPTNNPIPENTTGCRPVSGLGNGLAENESADDNDGPAQYIWRFAQHQGDLFMGILNVGGFGGGGGGEPGGFNLYKTNAASHGVDWALVTNDAFGWGSTSYGVRTLESTDATPGVAEAAPTGPWVTAALSEPALFVGVANPYGPDAPEGGAQVFMGTTAPSFPPQASIGGDLQAIGVPMATMDFDASGSTTPFSTAVVTDWQFYTGHGLTCASPGTADSTGTATYGPMLTSTPFPYVDYPYTLKVIDSNADFNCAEFTARAWSNLPPTVEITTIPPARPGGNRDRAFVVDWDGDGVATFDLTVKCLDTDSALDLCFKDFDNVDSTYFFPDNSVLAPSVNEFTAKVTMLQTGSTPNLDVIAVDEWADDFGPLDNSNPFFDQDGVDVQFIPFVDNVGTDDSPACQSGLVVALKNTQLDYKPDDPAPGYPTLCADPDPLEFPTALLYEVDTSSGDNPDAGDGFLDGGATPYAFGDPAPDHLEYVPGTDEVGLDVFNYEVGEQIDTGFQSTEVNLFVRVIECSIGVVYEVVGPESLTGTVTREGCIGVVTTGTTSVDSGDTTFRAGESIVLDNGFSVADGATLTLEIDPSVITGG